MYTGIQVDIYVAYRKFSNFLVYVQISAYLYMSNGNRYMYHVTNRKPLLYILRY